MSLVIYTSKEELMVGMQYVNYNDQFFQWMYLHDDETTKTILREIDRARYNSKTTFIGRDKDLGVLNKEYLSSGCKTLLNILYNPDKCFDISLCGNNALSLLRLIKNGNVVWRKPVLHFVGESDCDIIIDGYHFTDFREFLHYIMDEYH